MSVFLMPLKFSSEVLLRVTVCIDSSEQEIHGRLLQSHRARKRKTQSPILSPLVRSRWKRVTIINAHACNSIVRARHTRKSGAIEAHLRGEKNPANETMFEIIYAAGAQRQPFHFCSRQ